MASSRRAPRLLLAAALAGVTVTCGPDNVTSPNSTPTKSDFVGAAGPAAVITITRQPPATALDSEVWTPTTQPIVVVKDANGVAVAGAVVTASITGGPGTLQGPADTMLFCAGQTLMADGRLMVSGGHKRDDRGLDVTNIFDPVSQTWATGLPKMAKGRWYPTVTTLADGRVVTVAGRDTNSS